VTDANCADGVEVVESLTHVGGAPALMGRPLEQGRGKAQAKNAMACAPGPWRKWLSRCRKRRVHESRADQLPHSMLRIRLPG
jgi:hypothetical protein